MGDRALRSYVRIAVWAVVAGFVVFAFVTWGIDSVNSYSSLLTVLVGVVPYSDSIKKWLGGESPGPDAGQLDEAAAALREAVREQVSEDAGERHLRYRQDIMAVPWTPVGRGTDAEPGTVTALVERFATTSGRLVVVGDRGAGKSSFCLMLADRLLKDGPESGIPIRLGLSTWQPKAAEDADKDGFVRWLAHRIRQEHPYLVNPRYGTGVAVELLNGQRIVLLLDGLDELPEKLAQTVVSALAEKAVVFGDRYVLTSRPAELRAALNGRTLPEVQTVRLEPLTRESADSYIEARLADNSESLQRWDRVRRAILTQPDSPLAVTLTNPLMLRLTVDAYTGFETTGPDDLLDLSGFPDQGSIERHLLTRTLEAAYDPDSPKYGAGDPEVAWPLESALRWHRHIARHLTASGVNELTWWRMRELVPRRVLILTPMITGALACAPLGALFFGLFGRVGFGLLLGMAAGLVGGAVVGSLQVEQPRRFSWAAIRLSNLAGPDAVRRNIGFALVGVINGGVLTGLLYPLPAAVLAALAFGCVFGAARLATTPIAPKEPTTPTGTMAQDRRAVLRGAAWGAVTGALIGGTGAAVFTPRIHWSVHLSRAWLGLLGAGLGALLAGAGLGLMLYATSAWGSMTTVRWWLFLHKWTPFRLMTFLEDARKVEILRISGQHYQYRHLLLQEMLAGQDEDAP